MLHMESIYHLTAASSVGGGDIIKDLPIKEFGTSPCFPIQTPNNTRLTLVDWTESTSKTIIIFSTTWCL